MFWKRKTTADIDKLLADLATTTDNSAPLSSAVLSLLPKGVSVRYVVYGDRVDAVAEHGHERLALFQARTERAAVAGAALKVLHRIRD